MRDKVRAPGNSIRGMLGRVARPAWPDSLGTGEAAQLVEFALMLPLLVVLAVGLADFGAAFVVRDKLANAARDGARIAISQSTADLTQPNPLTVQAVRDAVVSYLNNAGVQATLSSASPCATGTFSWTYCLSNGGRIRIERQFLVNVGGTLILSSRVTVSYPYSWTFARVIGLLVPSSSYPSSFMISTESVMRN